MTLNEIVSSVDPEIYVLGVGAFLFAVIFQYFVRRQERNERERGKTSLDATVIRDDAEQRRMVDTLQ